MYYVYNVAFSITHGMILEIDVDTSYVVPYIDDKAYHPGFRMSYLEETLSYRLVPKSLMDSTQTIMIYLSHMPEDVQKDLASLIQNRKVTTSQQKDYTLQEKLANAVFYHLNNRSFPITVLVILDRNNVFEEACLASDLFDLHHAVAKSKMYSNSKHIYIFDEVETKEYGLEYVGFINQTCSGWDRNSMIAFRYINPYTTCPKEVKRSHEDITNIINEEFDL